ncbi:hypothetical protein SERLADRAFT_415696 [Serpula lacrymans var. lacrymans S7.9]|uniref:DUF6534 domain-containing protein n=1 Tax=Serpula lacrymans var. lacrymans (strain S7.9) TaxID=578457 RepID=F8NXK0_SERL9|nr:uncharacterized protein SERLADRAFT_415696 [Serpula lacrymans var. lacrymans S7.9]EGO24672.1 hypothetical protein SERLADRAFT_415696 [Serpula lacrymans var. lacrymans S7.9]
MLTMPDINSEMSAIPQLVSSLSNSFGAFYVSLLLAAILYGFTSLQLVIYIQSQWKYDRVVYRIMTDLKVVLLWLLDTIHVTFISHMLYYYLISNFANPPALSVIVWSFKGENIMTMIIILSVHCLYVHRLWILGKGRNRILSLVQVVTITLLLGLSMREHISRNLYDKFQTNIEGLKFNCTRYLEMLTWEPITVLSVLAFNDFLVASSMCYLLALSRTGFSKTDTTIKRIALYVCGSGCLTSICSLTAIITCAVMPDNSINLAIDFLLSKLYVNSFMALLNSRSQAECFGDATLSTFGAAPHPVKGQDKEHQTYLGVQFEGRQPRQTLCTNAPCCKEDAGSPLNLDSPNSTYQGSFQNYLPISALTL